MSMNERAAKLMAQSQAKSFVSEERISRAVTSALDAYKASLKPKLVGLFSEVVNMFGSRPHTGNSQEVLELRRENERLENSLRTKEQQLENLLAVRQRTGMGGGIATTLQAFATKSSSATSESESSTRTPSGRTRALQLASELEAAGTNMIKIDETIRVNRQKIEENETTHRTLSNQLADKQKELFEARERRNAAILAEIQQSGNSVESAKQHLDELNTVQANYIDTSSRIQATQQKLKRASEEVNVNNNSYTTLLAQAKNLLKSIVQPWQSVSKEEKEANKELLDKLRNIKVTAEKAQATTATTIAQLVQMIEASEGVVDFNQKKIQIQHELLKLKEDGTRTFSDLKETLDLSNKTDADLHAYLVKLQRGLSVQYETVNILLKEKESQFELTELETKRDSLESREEKLKELLGNVDIRSHSEETKRLAEKILEINSVLEEKVLENTELAVKIQESDTEKGDLRERVSVLEQSADEVKKSADFIEFALARVPELETLLEEAGVQNQILRNEVAALKAQLEASSIRSSSGFAFGNQSTLNVPADGSNQDMLNILLSKLDSIMK